MLSLCLNFDPFEVFFRSYEFSTGKSLSEVLILASITPKYDGHIVGRIMSSVQVQHMLCTLYRGSLPMRILGLRYSKFA